MADYIGQQMGNYRLSKLLGQGGFANVYLAEHVYLKTSVAIKVLQVRLTDDALDKFLVEARTIARFSHPHIIRVLEFGIEQNTPFLVMNYAPYGSLRQRHPAGSVLTSAQVLAYVQQVASALQYAHDRMVIHRDVKPENILLGEAFALLLSDFGLATTIQQQSHNMSSMLVHHTQTVAGTTIYMAPEQFDGTPSPASDQYALAVLVYEWFCGTPPFRGSDMGVAIQHIQTPPPPLREKQPALAPAIEAVVLRALAKDPHARFPSVQAFASALVEACGSGSSDSNYGQSMPPIVLPPVTSVPSGPPSSANIRGSRLHDYASATVADHAFAPQVRGLAASTEQRTSYPQQYRDQPGDFPVAAGAQARPPISRRKMILSVAGVAGGLAVLGAGGAWAVFSRSGNTVVTTPPTHNKPTQTPLPTPNAEATAQAMVNAAVSRPSVATLGSGSLDLFVRSADNTLWSRSYTASWGNWASLSLGGPFLYDPVAVSWDGQRIDFFMRGADNTLQHRVYSNGTWSAWESLGGSLASDPTVASWQPGRLDVFARGAADNGLWHIAYDGQWSAWEPLGGLILDSPTVTSWAPNRLDVFARGADNGLWHMAWDTSAWSGWQPVGGTVTSSPTVASWGPQRLDVFIRGTDATLQHIWYDGNNSATASWQPWESLGGQMEIAPTAVSWRNQQRIDIFARSANATLQHIWFDEGWHPWSPLS